MAANPSNPETQYSSQYQAWVSAGGPADNFRTYILAQQAGPTPTAEDVAFALGQANAHLTELIYILQRYGQSGPLQLQIVLVATPPKS